MSEEQVTTAIAILDAIKLAHRPNLRVEAPPLTMNALRTESAPAGVRQDQRQECQRDADQKPRGSFNASQLDPASAMVNFTYHGREAEREKGGLGRFVTVGDVGYRDADGYLYLCDRARDMIISGGVNIYPDEIEAVLLDVPGVKDCAVFGIPDEEYGEAVCAWIEADEGPRPARDEVRSALAQRLAKFKVPKLIEISEQLPREGSGKIFKRRLRQPYWEVADTTPSQAPGGTTPPAA